MMCWEDPKLKMQNAALEALVSNRTITKEQAEKIADALGISNKYII